MDLERLFEELTAFVRGLVRSKSISLHDKPLIWHAWDARIKKQTDFAGEAECERILLQYNQRVQSGREMTLPRAFVTIRTLVTLIALTPFLINPVKGQPASSTNPTELPRHVHCSFSFASG